MSTLIHKARKGDSNALHTLYNNNKEQILFLCTVLLTDQNSACNATARIFRTMWNAILNGEIETEAEFTRVLTDKAVNYCKSLIVKKDPKAFRLPACKNFANTNYS